MATVDEYLNNLLIKKSNNNGYTQNEERAYSYMYDLINRWKQSFNNTYYWNNIQIEMQKSGSKAKGDAIKGKSDIDIFVSITDRNNTYSVKDYYENLYNFLKPHFINENIRKQNVSIGVTYAGCSIDITPGKRVNYNSFNFNNSYSDHNIYSRKNDSITLTNIQKHIDLVQHSGLTKEMMILKIWRNCHNLELPSIAIEIIVNDVLKYNRTYSLYGNVKKVLESLRDTIISRKIMDPANSNNNIANTMTSSEKEEIRKIAIQSLGYDHGDTVTISKIVW